MTAPDEIRDFCGRDDDHAATVTLLLIFAIIVAFSRRRTATVGTLAWSIFLSRAIGARQRRNAATISRLFAEKTSVGAALESHARWHGDHDAGVEQRLSGLEKRVAAHGRTLDANRGILR